MNVWIHRDKGGFSERNHKAALPNLCAATTIPHSSFLIPNFSRAATFAARPLMGSDAIRPTGPYSLDLDLGLDLTCPQGLSSFPKS